jgi:hypothetical protein
MWLRASLPCEGGPLLLRWRFGRSLVAFFLASDLLLWAKHLFVVAMLAGSGTPPSAAMPRQANRSPAGASAGRAALAPRGGGGHGHCTIGFLRWPFSDPVSSRPVPWSQASCVSGILREVGIIVISRRTGR